MQKDERWEYYKKNISMFKNVSGVFAVSDYYACDLICFLHSEGFSIPKDISVVGFDDTPMCKMVLPTLTSVRQDSALRAKLALDKLAELKESLNEIGETEIVLPVSLVVRDSSI